MTTSWGERPGVSDDTDVVVVTEVDEIVIDEVEIDVVEVDGVALTETTITETTITETAITEIDVVGIEVHAADRDRAPSQGSLPLDVTTGDPRVDAAVASLRDLDQLPVTDHAEVFTQVHRDLQDALLSLDQG